MRFVDCSIKWYENIPNNLEQHQFDFPKNFFSDTVSILYFLLQIEYMYSKISAIFKQNSILYRYSMDTVSGV